MLTEFEEPQLGLVRAGISDLLDEHALPLSVGDELVHFDDVRARGPVFLVGEANVDLFDVLLHPLVGLVFFALHEVFHRQILLEKRVKREALSSEFILFLVVLRIFFLHGHLHLVWIVFGFLHLASLFDLCEGRRFSDGLRQDLS